MNLTNWQQPLFVLRNDLVSDRTIDVGAHIQFFARDYLYEPLYEIVADSETTEPYENLTLVHDGDTDDLWALHDVRSGRIAHSDLTISGWRHAEEITVRDSDDAVRLASQFATNANESGLPPIPGLDANYVTAVTLWPHVTDELRRNWLGGWFDASLQYPEIWEDIDWPVELYGFRYLGMPAEQALTAATVDLEIAVKASLPRHLLPTADDVREFLHGEDPQRVEPDLAFAVVTPQPERERAAIAAALGPLTPPATQTQAAQEGVNQVSKVNSMGLQRFSQQEKPQRRHH